MSTRPPRTWPTQIRLPGQAAAPEGPVDMHMMYVMHHAFRRDLEKFDRSCPAHAGRGTGSLGGCWRRGGRSSPRSCTAPPGEDAGLWPLLLGTGRRRTGRRWRRWRPSTRSSTRCSRLRAGLHTARRARGRRRPGGARRTPGGDAGVPGPRTWRTRRPTRSPILQRLMTPGAVAGPGRGALQGEELSLRKVAAVVPWAAYGVPRDALDRVFAQTGPGFKLVWLATRERFARARGPRLPATSSGLLRSRSSRAHRRTTTRRAGSATPRTTGQPRPGVPGGEVPLAGCRRRHREEGIDRAERRTRARAGRLATRTRSSTA